MMQEEWELAAVGLDGRGSHWEQNVKTRAVWLGVTAVALRSISTAIWKSRHTPELCARALILLHMRVPACSAWRACLRPSSEATMPACCSPPSPPAASDDDYVTSVAWARDGRHLAVGLSTSTVQLWDVTRMKQVSGGKRFASSLESGEKSSSGQSCMIWWHIARFQH